MLLALTRDVSPTVAACQLTHAARTQIDLDRARRQHDDYRAALARLGCRVESLPALTEFPDAVFVEDAAVVVDEIAVITRPGHESRRGETDHIAPVLAQHRPLFTVTAPATLDGGDVLRLGRTLFVGRTARTNDAGIEQLRAALAPHGYTVHAATTEGCLHLKTAATAAGDGHVLVNPEWIDAAQLQKDDGAGRGIVEVSPEEPGAANVLTVNRTVLCPADATRTADRLRTEGIAVQTIDMSELAKAEGGLTCSSVILRVT